MTTIFLLRHGQSLGNVTRSFLGHTDLDLSPRGYEQANAACDYLSGFSFDTVFSSDLLRARHTADPLASRLGLPVTPARELREIYAGEWEGKTFSEIRASYPADFSTFCHRIGESCPTGGESAGAVRERMTRYMTALARENDGKTVLCVSHATAICLFCAEVLGLSPEDTRRLQLPTNASVSVVLYENGEFFLRKYSEDAYLGALRSERLPLA